MSFVVNPGTVQTPLTSGGVAYGTGTQVKVGPVGTSGQVLISGGSGVPTWTTLSSGSQSFVASGSITAGNSVALNSNGTVSAVAGTVNAYSVGSAQNYWAPASNTPSPVNSVAYDASKGKLLVAYRNDAIGGYPSAVVGTITGSTVSYGTAVVISSNYCYQIFASYDQTAQVVVVGYDYASTIAIAAMNISGTSVTVGGSAVPFSFGTCGLWGLTYSSLSGGTFIMYADNVNRIQMNVATYNGAAFSVGAGQTISPAGGTLRATNSYAGTCIYDPVSQKIAVFYATTNGYLWWSVITTSGTSITGISAEQGGTSGSFILQSNYTIKATYSTGTSKMILAWNDYGTYNFQISAAVFSISGTTLTVGTKVVVTGSNSYVPYVVALSYDQATSRAVLAYSPYDVGLGQQIGTYVIGTDTASTISWSSATNFNTDRCDNYYSGAFAYVSSSVGLYLTWAYKPSTQNPKGSLYQFYAGVTSNVSNWIGVATQTVSNGQSLNVTTLGGINNSQSGLTIQSTYYCDNFGNMTTNSTNNIKVGKAVSATGVYVTNGNA